MLKLNPGNISVANLLPATVPNELPAKRQVEYWPIDRPVPYVNNARTHSAESIRLIADSIREVGWTNPILASPDGTVIAGHARLLAAHELGLPEVPVIVITGITDIQRRALVLKDNQLALNAGWDYDLLQQELEVIDAAGYDVGSIGFDDEELRELLAYQDAADGLTDEDAIPDVAEHVVSLAGDVWALGKHRLLCGDATVPADAEKLMEAEAADLILTDPPYNVDYQGYTKEKLMMKGDCMSSEDFRKFLSSTFSTYRGIIKSSASLYVFHPSSWQREFQNAMEAEGFAVRCQIVWVKNTFGWGFGRYKFQHEPIFYGHVAGEKDCWYGDKSQSTAWFENKPAANPVHPTAKPVELIERALANSSKPGNIVVDLFGGSGSTLIGCERRGRRARLMELDPRYVDCIVRRWQDYTGQRAVLHGTGAAFEEVAAERQGMAA